MFRDVFTATVAVCLGIVLVAGVLAAGYVATTKWVIVHLPF